ncbi:MAG: TIGR02221 family CRISPR-associated protein [Phycisphaerae bacterium]
MSTKLLTFLGTSDYEQCFYSTEAETTTEKLTYIQEALIELGVVENSSSTEVVIFLTKDSEQKHFEALNDRLGKFKVRTKSVLIPFGRSVDEIWEIFSAVNSEICANDSVVLDITHGFRSLPMLGLTLINYAKVAKDICVEGVYYAPYVSGRDNTPIFDLSEFDNLLEWTTAADQFVTAGSALKLEALVKKHNSKVQRGKLAGESKEDWRAIGNFVQKLASLTQSLSTCRLKDLSEQVRELQRLASKITDNNSKPIHSLISTANREVAPISNEDPLACGIAAARFCLNHNMIQQGITIVQEAAVTKVLIEIGVEDDKIYDYDKIRKYVTLAAKSFNRKIDEPQAEVYGKIKDFLKVNKQLVAEINSLTDFRNDVNHAGMRDNSSAPTKIKSKLCSAIDVLTKYI